MASLTKKLAVAQHQCAAHEAAAEKLRGKLAEKVARDEKTRARHQATYDRLRQAVVAGKGAGLFFQIPFPFPISICIFHIPMGDQLQWVIPIHLCTFSGQWPPTQELASVSYLSLPLISFSISPFLLFPPQVTGTGYGVLGATSSHPRDLS